MLRISWTRHISNEKLLQITKTKRTIWIDIREKQRKLIGHVIWKEDFEWIVKTRGIHGKKSRRTQRKMMLTFFMAEDYMLHDDNKYQRK